MSKGLKKQLENRLNNLSWLSVKRAKGDESVAVREDIKKTTKEIAEITAEMSGYDEDDEPAIWTPNFPDRKEILSLKPFPEYSIHYMGLAGWAYRNIDTDPDMVYQQIYELARRTRKARAKFLRTFLINGSRKKGEEYMMDALPWGMVIKDGRRKIDFDRINLVWWDVVEIIEEACKYWGIEHRPTFRMERYNQDIFHFDNNVQKIHGEWSDKSAEVTIKFMRDFMQMQKDVRNNPNYKSPFEFFNEPLCWGDHVKLGAVADYHLKMWRGVEDLTTINRAVTCSRGCEGAHANFVEKHFFDGRYYGVSPEFDDRKVKPEYHGVSTLQSLYSAGGFIAGLGCAKFDLSYNEDGHGEDGSYSPIPWTNFNLANAEELYEMQYHGHTESQRRGKRFNHTVFMMDCLRRDKQDKMIAKEEFDPEQIAHMNWERTMQYRKMREDLHN